MKYSTEIPTPFFNKYTIIFGLYGMSSSMMHNGLTRRPLWTGMHRHAVCLALGSIIGYYVYRYDANKAAQNEYKHSVYVERHPDLFQPEEKQKVVGSYLNWVPLR